MKKTILYLLALLIIPIAAFGGGTTVVVGQPVASAPAETANFYFKLEAAGTDGNAGKVYDEISSSWIGTINGATFVSGCDNNGVMFDASTEYISVSSAEQSTAGLTDYNTGDVYFYYKPTAITGADQHIFCAGAYDGGELIRFFWDGVDDSRWTFVLRENWTTYTRQYENSDAEAGVCAYYRLVWDMSVPSVTLYKGTGPEDLAEQTGSDISGWAAENDEVSLTTLYIGNRDTATADHGNGIIDDFKWEQ